MMSMGKWEVPELSPLMGGERMDPLDRLIEMARHASPVDRLRLERTIAVIRQARLAFQLSHQAEQHAWEQLTQAKAASQRRREKGEGPPVELPIFGDRTPGSPFP
jgi:hypothetical protein